MRTVLFPYRMGSSSGRELASEIGVKRVYADGKYRPREHDLVINWGNAEKPAWDIDVPEVLNHPDLVAESNNKISAFRRFDALAIPTVDWTLNHDVARTWYENGEVVMARSLSRASGGRGITVCNPNGTDVNPRTELVEAQFYSRFQTHTVEYRVHVFQGSVFHIQRKRRLTEEKLQERGLRQYFPGERVFIRNHDRGYIYSTNVDDYHPRVTELARQAVSGLELDFGAVDVIHSDRYGQFVLEINSAPGLEGQTLELYASVLRRHINERNS